MQQSILLTESIRTIQIYYYSSPNQIFINTVLLQTLNEKHVTSSIKIQKTQISQPIHHNFGQAPFLCVNHTHIVKRPQLWDFMTLVLNIDPSRKYEFLSVVTLTEEISQVSNLFSDYDQNPYFVFISPWKKYKMHKNLQNKKHSFRQNSLFFSNTDDSLNKEHFIYKVNFLGSLMSEYQREYATKPEYLRLYKTMTYALIKHLKHVENTLYLTMNEVKVLKQIEEEFNQVKNDNCKENAEDLPEQRPVMRNIQFTNVHLNYLNQVIDQKIKQEQQNQDFPNEKQKLNQSIFKPVFSTLLFALTMWAFK